MSAFKTPIVFMVFNRPDKTKQVFELIEAMQPERLLVIADGPRAGRPFEAQSCAAVRSIATNVSWPCEVVTNFAEENMGCGRRIASGLNWAFQVVEEAVILEDDCLPDPTFFHFAAEMLDRYRSDERVAAITGTNIVEDSLHWPYSYYFSRIVCVWGWATWRSRWKTYDEHLTHWPALRDAGALEEIFGHPKDIMHWRAIFDGMYAGTGSDTWDYQWIYTNLFNNRLTVVPSRNLVSNLGFGGDATHTLGRDSRLTPHRQHLEFPMRHPDGVFPMDNLDHLYISRQFDTLPRRVARRIEGIWTRMSGRTDVKLFKKL